MKKHLPNILTLTGILLGIIALTFVIISNNIRLAFILILISAIIDRYDGIIARRLRAESNLGKRLDCANDIISFSIVPSTIILSLSPIFHFALNILLSIIYFLASLYRLHKFSNHSEPESIKGLPTTISGTSIVFILLILDSINLSLMAQNIYIMITAVLFSMLLVQSVYFRKI